MMAGQIVNAYGRFGERCDRFTMIAVRFVYWPCQIVNDGGRYVFSYRQITFVHGRIVISSCQIYSLIRQISNDMWQKHNDI